MDFLSDRILQFYDDLHFVGTLPENVGIMNPYKESDDIKRLCDIFYHKYYEDNNPRRLILGINPGRLGAGATGIPFTDTKRLNTECHIGYDGFVSHEPSSVFVYEMIAAYGGPSLFYEKFYINSVCPLGFIVQKDNGKTINYNYYDDPKLQSAVSEFIVWNIKTQIALVGNDDICYCFGTGKNFQYLNKLNAIHKFFNTIIPLEHPRFIMQYKAKTKDMYIDQYLQAFNM